MPELPDQINSTISHARIDPALAMFRDWQRHKLELSSVSLSLAQLKQWLNWWLMHDARLVNQDCSLMLDAIDSQCSQVQEPVAFMRLVLTALRAGDALDLEAMALQSRAPAAASEKPAAMDAIATLQSQQSIRNFIEQQMAEDPQLAGLNSAQLHQLVRAWVGETSALFLEAIEEQALLVRDVHAYFRSILQSLLLGQAVDLETFAAPAMLADTCDEAAPPIPHDAMPTQPEASPLPQPLQQTLPQRLADAFLRADLKPLEIIWPEIARFHPDVLLAAAKRYLRRPQEQTALVASAAPDMVLTMLAAIAPPVHRQIAPLVRNVDECNAILPEPWTVHEFTQRILRFALARAIDGAAGVWLDGLLQALDVNRAWSNDVAHAWRAILPPSPALEHALFGDAQERAQLTAAMPWAGEDALAVLLLRSSPLSETERRLAGLLVERLLEGRKLSGAIESALCQPAAIARLTSMTSGPVLAQLLVLLQPTLAAQLPSVLNAIAGSVVVTNVPAMQTSRTWSVIYQSAFVAADPVTPTQFIRNLAHSASGRTDLALPSAVAGANRIETLLTLLRPMTLKESNPQPQQEQQAQQEQAWSSESHIRNAGMVIFATYMQRLFSILELTKDGKFVSDEAGQRAVHLLQYAVNGESSTPEFQLVLNKLFCGIHGGVPMVRGIEITQKEKEVIEQMLNGVIAHWSALGKTSISGLRQTFLQREGHLYFEEGAWHLRIPQATFDMLLDRLPWSFGMIKFPWMQHPLHVSWR